MKLPLNRLQQAGFLPSSVRLQDRFSQMRNPSQLKGGIMTEPEIQGTAESTPGLTQGQRIIYTFAAPSKTFEDIKRGNKSWWLPFLISVVFAYALFGAITTKVGWEQVTENVMNMNQKSAERMAQMPADQRATTMKFTQYSMEGGFAATPILVLVFAVVIAGVMLGTINFIFGGKAKFGSVFAVWFYASLPGLIKSILGTIVLFAGMAPESFNLANFAPTNLGAFLSPQDTNPALYKLATSLDFTTIWYLVLFGIGLSIVSGVKRSTGYIAVFGWWVIIVLASAGWAAAFG
ncbi:MAG: Yip1 family protein [Terracidiphilus sp.]